MNKLQPDADNCVTIDEAAFYLGIEVKRLRGYIWRRDWPGLIGDATANKVYAFSVEQFRRRQQKILAAESAQNGEAYD